MISAPPCGVSSDFGQLVVIRHLISGIDCAIAGAAIVAAPATPIPVTLIKSRRFIEFPSLDDVILLDSLLFEASWHHGTSVLGFPCAERTIATQKARPRARPGYLLIPPPRSVGSEGSEARSRGGASRVKANAPGWGCEKGAPILACASLPPLPALAKCRPASAAGAGADHEAVEGVFGNLPPQILIRAVGLHRINRLLEIRIFRRDLRPQFVGRLQ